MKKKIGSSKSLKKYAMAGPVESKPVIKGVASAMKSAAYDRAAEKFTQNYKPSTTKPNVPGIGQPTAKQQADMKKIETPPTMKKGGSAGKSKMKMGGSLKDVPTDKVGLSKLPTAVRNKMGYKKMGGTSKMKMGGSMKSKKK